MFFEHLKANNLFLFKKQLEQAINERNEKLKTEMMGNLINSQEIKKLKDF